MIKEMTEDEVRDLAGKILKFENSDSVISGVGQLTTFNQLGFKGVADKPDGWYLPKNIEEPAIILETKNSNLKLENFLDEIIKNCDIASRKYNKVIGILYNGKDVIVLKNNEVIEAVNTLQNKDYYLALFKVNKIDKQKIYGVTKKITFEAGEADFSDKNQETVL